MGRRGDQRGETRDFERQRRFNSKDSLKSILNGPGEPIPTDGFDYTSLPHRMSLEVPKRNRTDFDAHNHVHDMYREFADDYYKIKKNNSLIMKIKRTEGERETDLEYLIETITNRFRAEYIVEQLVMSVVGDAPDGEAAIEDLNTIPLWRTHKMDVVNDSGMSDSEMTAILNEYARKQAEPDLDMQILYSKLEVYYYKCKLEAEAEKDGEFLEEDKSLAFTAEEEVELRDLVKEINDRRTKLEAYHLIEKCRIVGNMAYIERASCVLLGGKAAYLGDLMTLLDVIHRERPLGYFVNEYLKGTFKDPDDEARFFLLHINEAAPETFLWMKVIYKPTPRAKALFKYGFLHPSDEITRWRERPLNDTWAQADAWIALGLDMIPPKRPIVDRVRRNLEHQLEQEPHKKKLAAVVSLIQRARSLRPIYDEYDMSCAVKYCVEFCQYCHTTSHCYRQCPKLPCSECKEESHILDDCPTAPLTRKRVGDYTVVVRLLQRRTGKRSMAERSV